MSKKTKTSSFQPPERNQVFAKVRMTNGQVKYRLGFDEVTEIEWKQLKEEAKTVRALRIWRIIQETVKNKALEDAIVHNKNWEEVMQSRGSYYTATSYDKILSEIING